MRITVELDNQEVQVVRDIIGHFAPKHNLEICYTKKEGVFGSANRTVSANNIVMVGELNDRIIPGIWKVVDKYSIQISGIIMMAKGLFQTYASVAAGLVQDIDGFIQDFKKQAKEDKPEEKADVVDKTHANPMRERLSFKREA